MIVLMLMAGPIRGSNERVGAILDRSRHAAGRAKSELIAAGIAVNRRNVLQFANSPLAALVSQNMYYRTLYIQSPCLPLSLEARHNPSTSHSPSSNLPRLLAAADFVSKLSLHRPRSGRKEQP